MKRVSFYIIVSLFLLVPLAHAQPELKVGQEVEVFYDGAWILCPKIVGFETNFEGFKELVCINPISPHTNTFHQPLDKADGYRILKPAPRPEFGLPYPQDIPYYYTTEGKYDDRRNYKTIVDNLKSIQKELRWLRKEAEGMREKK